MKKRPIKNFYDLKSKMSYNFLNLYLVGDAKLGQRNDLFSVDRQEFWYDVPSLIGVAHHRIANVDLFKCSKFRNFLSDVLSGNSALRSWYPK